MFPAGQFPERRADELTVYVKRGVYLSRSAHSKGLDSGPSESRDECSIAAREDDGSGVFIRSGG